MIDGQRRQLSVGNKCPLDLMITNQAAEDRPEPSGRLRHPGSGRIQPFINLFPCVIRCQRIGESSGAGHDSKKASQR